jgi:hypothetical protein
VCAVAWGAWYGPRTEIVGVGLEMKNKKQTLILTYN